MKEGGGGIFSVPRENTALMTARVEERELSFGSPNDTFELSRVPPGQARLIGWFSVPRKLEEDWRDPRVFQGRENLK